MLLLLFFLLLLSLLLAWFGKRGGSLSLFVITLLISVYVLLSHMTDVTGIVL